jgi:phage FluMu protein Com
MKTADEENVFEFYRGNDLSFTAPSGHTFTIREQNGDDDEVLSLIHPENKEESIKNFNIFLSKIIKDNSVNGKKYLESDEVYKLKLRDKYYILFKSRLHSIGTELKFKVKCPNKKCGKESQFREDLTRYDTDLSHFDDEAPRYKYQITPYLSGKDLTAEFVLSSGKKLKYTYMNVEAEWGMTKLDTYSNNTDLYARDLSLYNPKSGNYEILGAYNLFSKRDMIEINGHIEDNDLQFMMFVELKCPKCKHEWEIPFLYSKSFFFPGEI